MWHLYATFKDPGVRLDSPIRRRRIEFNPSLERTATGGGRSARTLPGLEPQPGPARLRIEVAGVAEDEEVVSHGGSSKVASGYHG